MDTSEKRFTVTLSILMRVSPVHLINKMLHRKDLYNCSLINTSLNIYYNHQAKGQETVELYATSFAIKMEFYVLRDQSFHTGIIPCAAKRFSTQKTMCFAVIFFSSTRNGSTVLGPELYDEIENPFGPVRFPVGKKAQNE